MRIALAKSGLRRLTPFVDSVSGGVVLAHDLQGAYVERGELLDAIATSLVNLGFLRADDSCSPVLRDSISVGMASVPAWSFGSEGLTPIPARNSHGGHLLHEDAIVFAGSIVVLVVSKLEEKKQAGG